MSKFQRVVLALFLTVGLLVGYAYANSRPNYGEGVARVGTLPASWICTESIAFRRDCVLRIELDNGDSGTDTQVTMKRNGTSIVLQTPDGDADVEASTGATWQILVRKGDLVNFRLSAEVDTSEFHAQSITEGL